MENEIVKQLGLCAAACDNCYAACLNESEVNMMTRCIELDRECADICRLTVSVIIRNAESVDKYLDLCIEICKLCGEECSKHEMDHCKQCAEACNKCVEVCGGRLEED